MRRRPLTRYFLTFALLLIAMSLSGCGESAPSVRDRIVGTWGYALKYEPDQSTVFDASGTQTYAADDSLHGTAEATLTLIDAEEQRVLRFNLVYRGTWQVQAEGTELGEVIEDQEWLPMDERTREILKQDPELARSFTDNEPETSTSKILLLTDSVMELEDKEDPDFRVLHERKG
ncbi:MAG: hypothetical protein ACPGU7_00935 [Gammaproteobacteria bacterium]